MQVKNMFSYLQGKKLNCYGNDGSLKYQKKMKVDKINIGNFCLYSLDFIHLKMEKKVEGKREIEGMGK